jgi:hypothetical protein
MKGTTKAKHMLLEKKRGPSRKTQVTTNATTKPSRDVAIRRTSAIPNLNS